MNAPAPRDPLRGPLGKLKAVGLVVVWTFLLLRALLRAMARR